MVHGDDSGLVLPPRIAPTQTMIIPIAQHKEGVLTKAYELVDRLKNINIRVKIDDTEKTPGYKFSEQEMLGIPTRIEIGPKDIEENQLIIVRRDTRERITIKIENLEKELPNILNSIQSDMYERAKNFLNEHTYKANNMEEMKNIAENKIGFIKANWCGNEDCENEIKSQTNGFGSRCMPIDEQENITGKCVCCEKAAKHYVVWGKSY